jgi:hypothetical protein
VRRAPDAIALDPHSLSKTHRHVSIERTTGSRCMLMVDANKGGQARYTQSWNCIEVGNCTATGWVVVEGSIASMAAATAGKLRKPLWASHGTLFTLLFPAPLLHQTHHHVLLGPVSRALRISDIPPPLCRLRVEPLFAAALLPRHVVFHVPRPAHSPSAQTLSARPPLARAG